MLASDTPQQHLYNNPVTAARRLRCYVAIFRVYASSEKKNSEESIKNLKYH